MGAHEAISMELIGRAKLPSVQVVGKAASTHDQGYGVLYRFWEQQLTNGLLDELVLQFPERLLEDTTIAVYGLSNQCLYRYLIGAMLAPSCQTDNHFDSLAISSSNYWHFSVRAPYWVENDTLWETLLGRFRGTTAENASFGLELYTRHYIYSHELRQMEFLIPADMVG